MVTKQSLQELQQRANDLAASLPDEMLTIEIEPNMPTEATLSGLILLVGYTLSYRGRTWELNCTANGLGHQIADCVRQLTDHYRITLDRKQTNALHSVLTWQP